MLTTILIAIAVVWLIGVIVAFIRWGSFGGALAWPVILIALKLFSGPPQ